MVAEDNAERLLRFYHAAVAAGAYDDETGVFSSGSATVTLTWGANTIEVPAFGVPSGWSGEGIVSLAVELTTGPTLINGLEDQNGNPIPDGFVFPATVFLLNTVIYDIIAINPYAFGQGGGVTWWNAGGGPPFMLLSPQIVYLPNLVSSDPALVGALWNDAGTLKVSAG